jgi:hypothetical protein
MKKLATAAFIVLTVMVSAVYLPMLYETLFFKPIGKTHLLFSPVTQRFIYREKIVGPIPPEAAEKSEDHHVEIAYRDADGAYYDRVEFEKNLPFIYYKNMELWGLLPLRLGGREFDKNTIKKNRQVLSLKPDEISDHRPQTPVWPILESNPGQARLVFPENRFRMTADAMEFINVDTNTVDPALTTAFTDALTSGGFIFPVRSVNGKFTILKPFDEGVFMVDAKFRVFHVKRRNGQPVVVKTPIDPALKTRHIKVAENKRREYYGLLLAEDGSLHLLIYDAYQLVRLPIDTYDPDSMDFKLLINPLYGTAVWSDETTVRAVAMDLDYQPIARYEHRMSMAKKTAMQIAYQTLFPFYLHLKQIGGGYLKLSVDIGGLFSLIGMIGSLASFTLWCLVRRRRLPGTAAACLVALTGIYGLIAVNIIELDN